MAVNGRNAVGGEQISFCNPPLAAEEENLCGDEEWLRKMKRQRRSETVPSELSTPKYLLKPAVFTPRDLVEPQCQRSTTPKVSTLMDRHLDLSEFEGYPTNFENSENLPGLMEVSTPSSRLDTDSLSSALGHPSMSLSPRASDNSGPTEKVSDCIRLDFSHSFGTAFGDDHSELTRLRRMPFMPDAFQVLSDPPKMQVETSPPLSSPIPLPSLNLSPLPVPFLSPSPSQSRAQSLALPPPPWANLPPQPLLSLSSRGKKRRRKVSGSEDPAIKQFDFADTASTIPSTSQLSTSIAAALTVPDRKSKSEQETSQEPISQPVLTYRLKTPTGSVVLKEDYMATFLQSFDLSEAGAEERTRKMRLQRMRDLALEKKEQELSIRMENGMDFDGRADRALAEVTGRGDSLKYAPNSRKKSPPTPKPKLKALVESEIEDGPVKETENVVPIRIRMADCKDGKVDVYEDEDNPGHDLVDPDIRSDAEPETEESWTREGQARSFQLAVDEAVPRKEIERYSDASCISRARSLTITDSNTCDPRIVFSHCGPSLPFPSQSLILPPTPSSSLESVSAFPSSPYPGDISQFKTSVSLIPRGLQISKHPLPRKQPKSRTVRIEKSAVVQAEYEEETRLFDSAAKKAERNLLREMKKRAKAEKMAEKQRKKNEDLSLVRAAKAILRSEKATIKVEKQKQRLSRVGSSAERERLWWEKEKEKQKRQWEAEEAVMKGVIGVGDDGSSENPVNALPSLTDLHSSAVTRKPSKLSEISGASMEREQSLCGQKDTKRLELELDNPIVKEGKDLESTGKSEKVYNPVDILSTLGLYTADATWELRELGAAWK